MLTSPVKIGATCASEYLEAFLAFEPLSPADIPAEFWGVLGGTLCSIPLETIWKDVWQRWLAEAHGADWGMILLDKTPVLWQGSLWEALLLDDEIDQHWKNFPGGSSISRLLPAYLVSLPPADYQRLRDGVYADWLGWTAPWFAGAWSAFAVTGADQVGLEVALLQKVALADFDAAVLHKLLCAEGVTLHGSAQDIRTAVLAMAETYLSPESGHRMLAFMDLVSGGIIQPDAMFLDEGSEATAIYAEFFAKPPESVPLSLIGQIHAGF